MKRIFALLMLLCVTVPASAQLAPAAVRADVRSILAAPQDGLRVILTGTILGILGGGDYMFTDGTGHLRISVGADLLPGQVLVRGTRVELAGRVNHHLTGSIVTISADYIKVLKGRADSGDRTGVSGMDWPPDASRSTDANPTCIT